MQKATVDFTIDSIRFDKYTDGLLPAIVQDATSRKVLMLGFMNVAAWQKTLETGKVTFYSRSRQSLWTKGETSGHFLYLQAAYLDCDADTLLLMVEPSGPVCHTGADTCFFEDNKNNGAALSFFAELANIIRDRRQAATEASYTRSLFDKGIEKIAQKVGEEAVEVVIEALRQERDRLCEEVADLMYHLLVLLEASQLRLEDVAELLQERHIKGK